MHAECRQELFKRPAAVKKIDYNLLSKSSMAARTTCVGDLLSLTDQIFLCGLERVLSQARDTSCDPKDSDLLSVCEI